MTLLDELNIERRADGFEPFATLLDAINVYRVDAGYKPLSSFHGDDDQAATMIARYMRRAADRLDVAWS